MENQTQLLEKEINDLKEDLKSKDDLIKTLEEKSKNLT